MRNPALLLAIVQAQDADAATQALTQAGLRATRISTIGGFLRESNVTLLIGLEHGDIARAAQLLSQHCRKRITYVNAARAMTAYDAALAMPIEVEVGGATIFALAVTRYVRFGAEPFQSSAPR